MKFQYDTNNESMPNPKGGLDYLPFRGNHIPDFREMSIVFYAESKPPFGLNKRAVKNEIFVVFYRCAFYRIPCVRGVPMSGLYVQQRVL